MNGKKKPAVPLCRCGDCGRDLLRGPHAEDCPRVRPPLTKEVPA